MRYARFERIVVLVMTIAIAAMAAAMAVQKTDAVEIFGHAMMILVIVASLYWGKRGALLGFLASFAAYTAARLVWSGDFGYGTAAQLIAAKFVVYGILALLCLYIRIQFRYLFVKLENQDFVDDETQVGNERFLARELTLRISESERYAKPFSVIDFSLDEGFVGDMQQQGVRVLRDLSISILKGDTRSVDEIARNRNDLLLLLPNVGREGAEACARRIEAKMSRYLGQHLKDGPIEEVLQLSIYEYPEDKAQVEALLARLRPDPT